MSTKSIILTLIGVIIIGSAVYFTMDNKKSADTLNTPPVSATQNEATVSTKEPEASASTDEIIDYIIDGQSSDETKAAQASLERSSAPATDPTITTNF